MVLVTRRPDRFVTILARDPSAQTGPLDVVFVIRDQEELLTIHVTALDDAMFVF